MGLDTFEKSNYDIIEEKNPQDKYRDFLDSNNIFTLTEKKATTGKIHDFLPNIKNNERIVLNYENTQTKYKRYTNVIAKRDAIKKTYRVESGMNGRKGKRALIFPNTKIQKKTIISKTDETDKTVEIKNQNLYEEKLKTTFFLGHSFVVGYETYKKFGIKGATINKIKNTKECLKNLDQNDTLVIDLGINDYGLEVNKLIEYYEALIKTIREKGYTGDIHIIGISEVNKVLGGLKTIQNSNDKINDMNNGIKALCNKSNDLKFHIRNLEDNIDKDGLHPKNKKIARNQILKMVYNL